MTERATVLAVDGLRVDGRNGFDIVDDVSFTVGEGEILGVVGESGCGKTTTALALLGHAREGTKIVSGSVSLRGTDILRLDPAALRGVRGRLISYVPQDPTASLSPRQTSARRSTPARISSSLSSFLTGDGPRFTSNLFGTAHFRPPARWPLDAARRERQHGNHGRIERELERSRRCRSCVPGV